MPVQEKQRQHLIEKRARALAMTLLTHRQDLRIEEVTDDIGLDYIVRFHTAGKEGLREFGIELRGVWTAVTREHADKVLRPSLQGMSRYGPFLRPVCLFLFTMENDGAWYTWVAEPAQSSDGTPRLSSCTEPHCRQLDKKALKEIIDRVDSWYEAVFPSLVLNGPRRSKGPRKETKQ